jgi:DHA1 family bicyclomycin/chloramphenicol resistance-like MFS transporter
MQQKTSIVFIIVTTMMGVLTLLPSDIYLPALPILQNYFHTSASMAALTLSVFFLGAGISQIIAGPIVDRFDNKLISLVGLIIFILSSLMCIIANSIELLIVYRFIQAFSAGFVVVVSRALVVKLCNKEEALRVFLIMSPIIAISPGIAPIIGGYTANHFGWKASFVFITIFGLILIYLSSQYLSKTTSNYSNFNMTNIFHTYIKLFSNKKFNIYLLLRTGIDASYFGYITASPFIFYSLGYSALQIGNFYLLVALSYIIMTYICGKITKKIGLDATIFIGMLISLLGIFLLAVIDILGFNSAILIIIAASIMTAGYGFAGPLAWSEAMAQFPDDSGITSSLIGFMPLVGSAIVASFINIIANNSASRLAIGLFILLFIPMLVHYKFILCKD